MIYEIRVRRYMSAGSSSLNKFFRSKEKATEYVAGLNEMLNWYYINEIKLEDED